MKTIHFHQESEKDLFKVIGIGGAGINTVNRMAEDTTLNASYMLCDTSKDALQNPTIPTRLLLGREGLGTGNNPERGRRMAEENIEEIKNILSDGTSRVIIIAGLGGGTATGVAPVVARVCRELGIFTIGIFSIPFKFEGRNKINVALNGLAEMSVCFDKLYVVNNERMKNLFCDLSIAEAFTMIDKTICATVQEIIITQDDICVNEEGVELLGTIRREDMYEKLYQ